MQQTRLAARMLRRRDRVRREAAAIELAELFSEPFAPAEPKPPTTRKVVRVGDRRVHVCSMKKGLAPAWALRLFLDDLIDQEVLAAHLPPDSLLLAVGVDDAKSLASSLLNMGLTTL